MKSAKKIHISVVFKPYDMSQLSLLPSNLGDLIDGHHPVRVVNAVIDRLDIRLLESAYLSGGTSSYPPPNAIESDCLLLFAEYLF